MAAPVYVKPREGGRVRMPDRNYTVMPAAGDYVDPDESHYARLLITGDVERCDPPAKAAEPATDDAAPAEPAPASAKRK